MTEIVFYLDMFFPDDPADPVERTWADLRSAAPMAYVIERLHVAPNKTSAHVVYDCAPRFPLRITFDNATEAMAFWLKHDDRIIDKPVFECAIPPGMTDEDIAEAIVTRTAWHATYVAHLDALPRVGRPADV